MLRQLFCLFCYFMIISHNFQQADRIPGFRPAFPEKIIKTDVAVLNILFKMVIIILILQQISKLNVMGIRKAKYLFYR